jgi:hypothetical protein
VCHLAEPDFAGQLFSGNVFDDIQQFLGDEAFEFAEGLFGKNRSEVGSFVGGAFAENQRPHVVQQGRRFRPFALQGVLALEGGQRGQFARRELQQGIQFVIQIGPVRGGGRFFPRQQLRNVGFCDGGGPREVALLEP